MPKSTKKQLRALWLQVHKWIGLALAVLIIPISLTGAALVWHDGLEAQLEPQRHAVLGQAALPPSAYAAAATAALGPDERLATLRFSPDGEPVVAVASKPAAGGGRPERTNVWLDPRDAAVIDRASANAGIVRAMHQIHGSMMVPGGWGRPLVGWVGVAMFVSCLTGIWLWWPLSGGFASGFRWKRRNTVNANLHYMIGFWVLIPLAMLSFTGAWISFPSVFGAFESGPARGGPGGGRGGPAQPLVATQASVDEAVAAATPYAQGKLLSVGWPTEREATWTVQFETGAAPAEVKVADAGAVAAAPEPPQPETLARTMRRWHDGTGMGLGWQLVIFLGGIIPAALSVTGLIIWWRARQARRRAQAALRPATA